MGQTERKTFRGMGYDGDTLTSIWRGYFVTHYKTNIFISVGPQLLRKLNNVLLREIILS